MGEAVLAKAARQYRFKELARLKVVYVSPDMVGLADVSKRRLFTAVRGTDATSARDLGNDLLIALGYGTARTSEVELEYCKLRRRFPMYDSYGCGHSLGGTVMHELAQMMEKTPALAFKRVDVF